MQKHESCGTKLSIVYTTASSKWIQLQTKRKSQQEGSPDITILYYWCKKCEVFVKVVQKVFDVK